MHKNKTNALALAGLLLAGLPALSDVDEPGKARQSPYHHQRGGAFKQGKRHPPLNVRKQKRKAARAARKANR